MKKGIYLLFSIITIFCFFTACKPGTGEIILSFDKDAAYFSSSVELEPISGYQLSQDDIYEKASVVIKVTTASILKLDIETTDTETNYSGVKLIVNNGTPIDFENNANLYISAQAETEKSLEIKIYLEKNAPQTLKGKTIAFYFVLSRAE